MENNESAKPSQQPLVSQNSHHFSREFIVILVILLTITVGVGGYILGAKQNKIVQNQTPPAPPITQPSPTPVDETVNWKTYRNKEYGFEVKYPSQFRFFPRTERSFDIMDYDKFDPQFERGNMNGLRIFVAVDSDRYTNKQEALTSIEVEDELGKRTFIEEFSEEPYILFRNSRWNSGSGSLLSGVFMPSHAIYDPQTRGLAIFQIQDPSGDFKEVTQQILSTFKFTP